MLTINTSVASTLIGLSGLGVVFYITVVIAGISLYACPFQTPASIVFRYLWKKVRPGILPYIVRSKQVLSWLNSLISRIARALSLTWWIWKRKLRFQLLSILYHIVRLLFRFHWIPRLVLTLNAYLRISLPIFRFKFSRTRRRWREKVRLFLHRPRLPTTAPLRNVQNRQSEPWLKPEDLTIVRRKNTDDVLCLSWFLINITGPGTLDAALPIAGEIRWFDGGDTDSPPYDLIVSTFKACFDPNWRLYLGSRDRAYYSLRAILWIHTLAMCKSGDFARSFPLPKVEWPTPVPDPDLEHLLQINHEGWNSSSRIRLLLIINQDHTPSHSQWISNLLLHRSWANRTQLNYQDLLGHFHGAGGAETTIPPSAALNRILVWCTLLGSPAEEAALKVRDKSYDISCFCSSSCLPLFTSCYMGPFVDRLSEAVLPAINGTATQQGFIPHMLHKLVKVENRPERLAGIACHRAIFHVHFSTVFTTLSLIRSFTSFTFPFVIPVFHLAFTLSTCYSTNDSHELS